MQAAVDYWTEVSARILNKRPAYSRRVQVSTAWMFPVILSAIMVGPLRGQTPSTNPRTVLDKYCVTCHNEKLKTAGLTLDVLDVAQPAAHAELWERVIRRLRTSTMPP